MYIPYRENHDRFISAVFSSMGLLFSIMEEIRTSHIGNLSIKLRPHTKLYPIIEMPEVTGMLTDLTVQRFEIRNVTFRYPGLKPMRLRMYH